MTTIPGLDATNTRDRCRCNAHVIHTLDDPDVLAIPITIDASPTTPAAALAAIVNGSRVVYSTRFKRERGAGVARDFRAWATFQFRLDFDRPLHVEHRCGVTHPPPPPAQSLPWPDDHTPPPF